MDSTVETNQQMTFDGTMLYQWGNEGLTSHHQRRFVKEFAGAPGRVLELGCGTGVLLSIFREQGLSAYGLDMSQESVDTCKSKGLDAVAGDVLEHVQALPPNSLGGVFAGHVIEHLQPDRAMLLIRELARVLKPGSKAILITPNAKDLRTTERFWLDPTHVRPYPEKLLRYLFVREGFQRVRTFTDAEPAKNIGQKLIKKFLHLWFMGYLFTGDLVVVAER
jgi:SAM-dependent methyltransferase